MVRQISEASTVRRHVCCFGESNLGSGDIVTVACPEEFVRSSGDTRFKCGHGLHGSGQWWLGPFLGESNGKISGSGGVMLILTTDDSVDG